MLSAAPLVFWKVHEAIGSAEAPKMSFSLQRYCKNEKIDSHAGWGRQKKTSATQHGKLILTDGARIDSFHCRGVAKVKKSIPTQGGDAKKKRGPRS